MLASPERVLTVGESAPAGLDPRTKIVAVLLASATVMSPGGLRFVPAALVLGVGLAVYERAWRRVIGLPLVVVCFWLLGWVLPVVWPNPVTAIVGVFVGYLIRFAVAVGVGMHLIATSLPTQLGAALRAWHIPRAITVTLTVMIRFFPVVASEAAAVLDAMRLRALVGTRGMTRHPVLSMERFTVPMIAASLRASEDLSASAILRGLGSRRKPTALVPPQFNYRDAVLALAVVVLTAAAILLPAPLT